MRQERIGSHIATLLPEPLSRLTVALEIFDGILQPHFVLLEESIHFITSAEPQHPTQLIASAQVLTVRLDSHGLQCGS